MQEMSIYIIFIYAQVVHDTWYMSIFSHAVIAVV